MLNRFQIWAIVTTLATYFLIGVGALVRAAGAGMGCPDWPRCFDRWIPPTDISQVPPHIDPALFNVTLAWIEYVNRLLGVTIGLLIFGTLLLAIRDYWRRADVLWTTVGAFVGVSFEGWLGSKVVASDLDPRIVTVHLIVALLVVGLLLYATAAAFLPEGAIRPTLSPAARNLGRLALLSLLMSIIQVGLGAWLRGSIEGIVNINPALERAEWLAQVGAADVVHRAGAFMLVVMIVLLYLRIRQTFARDAFLSVASSACIAGIGLQFIIGLILAELAIPPAAQVLHLLLGSLLMGAITLIVLRIYRFSLSIDV